MENSNVKEVTCYKIIQSDNLPLSQELFEIENSFGDLRFPVHEEYKLPIARSQFLSHTNGFTNKIIDDLRKSKMHSIHLMEKRKLFLTQSKLLVNHLKKRRKAFNDRSTKFIEESRRQLMMLDEECNLIAEETFEIQTDLNEILNSMRK